MAFVPVGPLGLAYSSESCGRHSASSPAAGGILHDHAVEQHGYVTTRDAQELGVSPRRLHLMRKRGVVDHVSRGVFRFPDVPSGALDQYAEATLWLLEVPQRAQPRDRRGLHDVCDRGPSRIDVTVPPGFRSTRAPPNVIRLHHEDLPEHGITWHEGRPIVTVYRAILGSIQQHVGWSLIEQAIDTARRQGRLTREHAPELRALRHRTATATV